MGINICLKGWFADVAVLAGLAGGCLAFAYVPDDWLGESDWSVAHHILREMLHGHLNGVYAGPSNRFSDTGLLPGDVLLAHNPGGGYGYWTHAAVYVGGGRLAESNDFVQGTNLTTADKFRSYSEVVALRPRVAAALRREAARRARLEAGKPYDPFAPLSDPATEYCSKLVWRVYDAVGVRLCGPKQWVLPDDLARSPQLHLLARWKAGGGVR